MQNDQKPRYKCRWFAMTIVLGLALLSGCDYSIKTRLGKIAPGDAVKFMEHEMSYYANELHIGMPKKEALAQLPQPQNTNIQKVCVWVLPSTETIETTNRLDWQWLQSTRGGFFIVFVDDKLATPLCANAAFDPWQALEYYSNLSSNQAEQILGRK